MRRTSASTKLGCDSQSPKFSISGTYSRVAGRRVPTLMTPLALRSPPSILSVPGRSAGPGVLADARQHRDRHRLAGGPAAAGRRPLLPLLGCAPPAQTDSSRNLDCNPKAYTPNPAGTRMKPDRTSTRSRSRWALRCHNQARLVLDDRAVSLIVDVLLAQGTARRRRIAWERRPEA